MPFDIKKLKGKKIYPKMASASMTQILAWTLAPRWQSDNDFESFSIAKYSCKDEEEDVYRPGACYRETDIEYFSRYEQDRLGWWLIKFKTM